MIIPHIEISPSGREFWVRPGDQLQPRPDSEFALLLNRRYACLFDLNNSMAAVYSMDHLEKQKAPPWRLRMDKLNELVVPCDMHLFEMWKFSWASPHPLSWPRSGKALPPPLSMPGGPPPPWQGYDDKAVPPPPPWRDNTALAEYFRVDVAPRFAFYIELRPMTQREITNETHAGNWEPLAVQVDSGKKLKPYATDLIAKILRGVIQKPPANKLFLPKIERAPGVLDNTIERALRSIMPIAELLCEEFRLFSRDHFPDRSQGDIDRKALMLASREYDLPYDSREDHSVLRTYMRRGNNDPSRYTPRVCDFIGLPLISMPNL